MVGKKVPTKKVNTASAILSATLDMIVVHGFSFLQYILSTHIFVVHCQPTGWGNCGNCLPASS